MKSMKLNECPFCGEKPDIFQKGQNTIVIKCKCGITKTQKVLLLTIHWLREKMIQDWNTRTYIQ